MERLEEVLNREHIAELQREAAASRLASAASEAGRRRSAHRIAEGGRPMVSSGLMFVATRLDPNLRSTVLRAGVDLARGSGGRQQLGPERSRLEHLDVGGGRHELAGGLPGHSTLMRRVSRPSGSGPPTRCASRTTRFPTASTRRQIASLADADEDVQARDLALERGAGLRPRGGEVEPLRSLERLLERASGTDPRDPIGAHLSSERATRYQMPAFRTMPSGSSVRSTTVSSRW